MNEGKDWGSMVSGNKKAQLNFQASLLYVCVRGSEHNSPST